MPLPGVSAHPPCQSRPRCHPAQPLTVPRRFPLLSHHQGTTNRPRTCVPLPPVALRGQWWSGAGGTAWGRQQLLSHQPARAAPTVPPHPGPVPGLPRGGGGPGVEPPLSQRPRLAAGGAGSAGFQQKPTSPHPKWPHREKQYLGRADRGPARRAQHQAPAARGAPHTPLCPMHVPWPASPRVFNAKRSPGCAGAARPTARSLIWGWARPQVTPPAMPTMGTATQRARRLFIGT